MGVTNRPLRPLAIVALLAFWDYLLWNWSVDGNHDVLALVAGVTLIPLSIAAAWLAVLTVAHLFASLARRSRNAAGTGAARIRHAGAAATREAGPGSAAVQAAGAHQMAEAHRPDSSASPSSRLAA